MVLSALVSGLFMDASAVLPSGAEALANAEGTTQAMLGGWSDVIGVHVGGLELLLLQSATFQGPATLAMFLLGMVVGRRQLLARVRGDEPILRQIQWVGFPVGIAGGVLYAVGGGNGETLAVSASMATAPLLTAAYVATVVRVMHRTTKIRAALVFVLQLAVSAWWLRRHQYGPAEWVLRWVTNDQRPRWRTR